MGLYRDELPPVEILKKLSEVCNQIARDSKAGIPVDLEKFVAEFPIEYRDDVEIGRAHV